MIQNTLSGKRILVTQADVFMGPDLCAVLAEHGADVVADTQAMHSPHAPAAALAQAGDIDVLVVNLAVPAPAGGGRQCARRRLTILATASRCPCDTGNSRPSDRITKARFPFLRRSRTWLSATQCDR